MIRETGYVACIDDRWIWVETRRANACAGCSARAGCGQGLFNGIFSGRRHYIKVPVDNHKGTILVHDKVEITLPEHALLTGSLLVYLLPLVFMITGAILGQRWSVGESDTSAIMGASIGFVLAGVLVRWYSVRHQADPLYQPALSRVVVGE